MEEKMLLGYETEQGIYTHFRYFKCEWYAVRVGEEWLMVSKESA